MWPHILHAIAHWQWSTIAAFIAVGVTIGIARSQTRERAQLLGRQIVVDVAAASTRWSIEAAKLPRARKASAAMAIPTAGEVGGAIRATDEIEPWCGAFIAVCAFAGLRLGEASALKVSDVDFMRKEIGVNRQVQWTANGRLEIRSPKYGSERTVYVPGELVTMLAEHVRLYRPGDDPDRWLFPAARDDQRPAHANTVGRWWRKVRDKVGIPYRLHDLRHFYASGLIAAGCDVVTVQRALGHASASVTLNTYSHLWPNANDRTRRAAAGLVKEALGATADALRTEGQN